jgi:ubiquinone/menaquinone biosynthesis C-methylase UbiE
MNMQPKDAMMFQDQRLNGTAFEKFADDYGDVRPGYPTEAIDDIVQECHLGEQSQVLEIGVGTGIATEALLKSGATFVGIEPGQNLLRIAQKKLGEQARITLVNQPFEEYQTDQVFDVVLSATAFHWLSKSDKYQRVTELLKPGGQLVIMWNSFCRNGDPVDTEIEAAYQRFLPDIYPAVPDVNGGVLNKANAKVREILDSRLFFLGFLRTYIQSHVYDSQRYVALLRTYPKNYPSPRSGAGGFSTGSCQYRRAAPTCRRPGHDNGLYLSEEPRFRFTGTNGRISEMTSLLIQSAKLAGCFFYSQEARAVLNPAGLS